MKNIKAATTNLLNNIAESAIAKNMLATARAVAGIAIGVGVVLPLTILQATVVGPLTNNYSVIPNLIYKSMRALFGYKIEFNKASAPISKDRSTWFVANHMSIADFIVLGSTLNGTFGGKGDILKWPAVAQMARAVRYMGFRRSSEFNAQSRAKLIKNFNDGFNAIMFPEGTTTDGKKVALFRGALPSILYGEKGIDKQNNEVTLEKDVVVQPVAIRIKAVNGKDATGNDSLRNLYSMYDEDNTLKRIWKRLQLRSTTIELTAFAPLDPAGFANSNELMNKAALDIASVVNPGQTTFEKAQIPGQAAKPAAPAV